MVKKQQKSPGMAEMIKEWCFIGVIIFCVLLVNILILKDQSNVWAVKISGTKYFQREEIVFTEALSSKSDRIEQYFAPVDNYLYRIYIRLNLTNEDCNPALLKYKAGIYEENGSLLFETEFSGDSFKKGGYYRITIDKKVDTDKTYTLKLQQTDGFEQGNGQLNGTLCYITPEELKESNGYSVNGEMADGNIELLYSYRYHDWTSCLGIMFGSILLILSAFILRHFRRKKEDVSRREKIESGILWAATPILMFVLLESVAGNLDTIGKGYVLKNLLILYIIYVVFSLCFSRQSTAAAAYCGTFGILALAEYYVLLFRGRPFTIFDIWSIGTAAEVAGSYSYDMPIKVGAGILMILFLIVLLHYRQKLILPARWWMIAARVTGIGAFAAFILLILKTDVMRIYGAETIELWNMKTNYQEKGSLYTLFLECQYVYIDKPEGYSVEEVEQISKGIDESVKSSENVQPENLIVIMNESLADFERLGPMNTDSELLPYIRSMSENTKKGWLQIPVLGGGTSDSEYEVLTGNTKQFMPAGTNAYEFYCSNPEYGLVMALEKQGYRSIALHPEKAKNWNRDKVYEEMGFDEFISIENWESDIEKLRRHPSDKSAYDKVKEIVEDKEKGEKLFTFLVTMQNHGGYSEEFLEDYTPVVSLDYGTSYPQAETYLSLINESDEAFEELIRYFENVEEPTMIVMFGDHYPGLSDGFYDVLQRWELSGVEITQRMYQTPYVIWTNYEQESSSDDIMSANYFGSYILQQAGFELTSYNKFLLSLKETLPVIGMGAVCDKEGQWYGLNELPEAYESLISQYRILQYNNVMDRKNICEEVFSLAFETES